MNMVMQLRRRQQQDNDKDDEQSMDGDDDSSKRDKIDEPFSIQIGSVLLLFTLVVAFTVAAIFYQASLGQRTSQSLSFREHQMLIASSPGRRPEHVDVVMIEEEGLDAMPPIELDISIAKHDAFGVAQKFLKNYASSFTKLAQDLQTEFTHLYGGIRPSRYLLSKSVMELEPEGTAWLRLFREKENNELHMVILGDGTAAGYGNHHEDAFSFILQDILRPLMQHFHIDFKVSNVALEHVTLFPYLWCASHFIQSDLPIDIVYADFGSLSSSNLEQVVRQIWGLQQKENSSPAAAPLLILRDSKDDPERIELLHSYIDSGILTSPVLIEWTDAVGPFLQVKPSLRPNGFENWDFMVNSPHNKKSYWTAKQHKLVAWILSMFFLKQMESMVANDQGFSDLQEWDIEPEMPSPILATGSSLRDPWANFLYHPSNALHCLSSFQPANNLIPSKGQVSKDALLEQPKGKMFYNSGWVLDLENAERKEKLQSQHLGFQDLLTSYHGIAASGTLEFDLGLGGKIDAVEKLIVCESQAAPQLQGCKLDQDVTFTINNKIVHSLQRITTETVSYLGKQHCVLLTLEDGGVKGKIRIGARVSNDKITISTACSISHIIW